MLCLSDFGLILKAAFVASGRVCCCVPLLQLHLVRGQSRAYGQPGRLILS